MKVRMKYFYVPSDLDLEGVLCELPSNSSVTKDHVGWVLSTIIHQQHISRNIEGGDGYVRLKSTIVQQYVHNYKEIINKLEEDDIISVNHSYLSSSTTDLTGYSKGYKVNPNYSGGIQRCTYSSGFTRKLSKKHRKHQKQKLKCDYLDKWMYDERLNFDYTNASAKIKELCETKLESTIENNTDAKFLCYSYSIAVIRDRSFYCGRDETSGRYHSALTNLKKELKQFFDFDGEELVQIDVKNCQPYLLQLLLSDNGLLNVRHIINNHKVIRSNSLVTNSISSALMLVKSLQGTEIESLAEFCDLVNKGVFYEDFISKTAHLDNPITTRKQAKLAIYTTFFSDNRFISANDNEKWDATHKKYFKECYPIVYDVIRTVKKKDKRVLAVILQSIESHIIVDVICKRISKEQPHIPLYTIHDSISSTPEHIDYIKKVMQEEFKALVGIAPELEITNW